MAKSKVKTKFGAVGSAKKDSAGAVKHSAADFKGPSPNPKTNLLLADIALRGGSTVIRRSLERGLLGAKYSPNKARQIIKGRSITEAVVGTVIAKLATRSIPGAIVVGGSMLAKALYDRRKGKLAEREGEVVMEEMAKDGRKQEG